MRCQPPGGKILWRDRGHRARHICTEACFEADTPSRNAGWLVWGPFCRSVLSTKNEKNRMLAFWQGLGRVLTVCFWRETYKTGNQLGVVYNSLSISPYFLDKQRTLIRENETNKPQTNVCINSNLLITSAQQLISLQLHEFAPQQLSVLHRDLTKMRLLCRQSE